jgi:hypothetical protein
MINLISYVPQLDVAGQLLGRNFAKTTVCPSWSALWGRQNTQLMGWLINVTNQYNQ